MTLMSAEQAERLLARRKAKAHRLRRQRRREFVANLKVHYRSSQREMAKLKGWM